MKKFTAKIVTMALVLGLMSGITVWNTKDKAYAASIDSAFPTSYKTLLNELAKEHSNWSFVAIETGLDWNTVISNEASNNKSWLQTASAADILLSKNSSQYNSTTGKYTPTEGTWVSATHSAVSYYMDPRNFLNENYIFQFEALGYNATFHTEEAVEAILTGTQMANKKISYVNTDGETVATSTKYSTAIYNAGLKNGVSPVHLAARIRQETGGKLTNSSISGKVSGYIGYYNYYNIKATGSDPIVNGLKHAKSEGWTTPILAINGGAKFIAKDYISRGQNTLYFQKFNVVSSPYYGHQYMQNLTAAVTEGNQTYTAYSELGIDNKAHVFYIPVYKNMPSQSSTAKISKSVSTAKMITTTNTNMRKGPSTSYGIVTSVPKGASVTVNKVVYMEESASVANRLAYPYWAYITYGSNKGYVILNNVTMNVDSKIFVGATKQLSVTKSSSSEKVYYESSNPTIAKVDSNGKITGVKAGTCQIYAITSSGINLDVIGIEVYDELKKPTLSEATNVVGGVKVTWKKTEGATFYNVYRKEASGSWSKTPLAKVSSGSTVSYTDKTVVSGKRYVYSVEAGRGSEVSSYNTSGLTVTYLTTPSLKAVTTTTTTATVTWEKVSEGIGYQVYRKVPGGSWSKIKTIDKNSTLSYKDSGLTAGKEYIYTVRSYNSNGLSHFYSAGITAVTVPAKTTMSSVENVNGGVKVTWKKVANSDGYAVYRKKTGGSYSKIKTITSASTVTYTDKTTASGTKYIYTVRATKKDKLGAYETAGKTITYLARPSLKSVSTTSSTAKITWSKIAGAKGYYVYRKKSGGSWSKIGTVKSGSTVTYTNKSLPASTKYIYTVRAYNGSYLSTFVSAGITATTKPVYISYKTTTKVNYRSGAGTSYAKKGTLAKGKKISVEKGYSKKANGFTWYRFKLNNKNYYIASKYIKKV